MARLLYSLLWIAALPIVLLRLVWRARKQPEYLHHLKERFGCHPHSTHPCIWLHAVSVGETRAAQPLIYALRQHYPNHDIVLTHMTPTGRATAQALFKDDAGVRSSFLPYDLPGCVDLFLQRVRPSIGLLMETELWPNLIAAGCKRHIPILLINARMSERSARSYSHIPSLSREMLQRLSAIAAQSPADALRLQMLGASSVEIYGNLKFDVDVPPAQLQLGERFREGLGKRKVILAASTREGEETLLLNAFKAHAVPDILLIIVPRHPQRFDDVAQLIAQSGLGFQRRSEHTSLVAAHAVWLGDSMGEMFAYYRCADIALMGGSWLAFGGQNLIEACAAQTPVVLGPHTYNFAQAAQDAIECGAAVRCKDIEEGVTYAIDILGNAAALEAMRTACGMFTHAHRGATDKTVSLIARTLGQPEPV